MASTAIRSPWPRYAVISALVTVDFPAPGEPVRPITRARPASGASSLITVRSRGDPSSISETSRARARGSPSCARLTSSGASLAEVVTPRSYTAGAGTRRISASPWPPPPHSPAAPRPPRRRGSSYTRCRAVHAQGAGGLPGHARTRSFSRYPPSPPAPRSSGCGVRLSGRLRSHLAEQRPLLLSSSQQKGRGGPPEQRRRPKEQRRRPKEPRRRPKVQRPQVQRRRPQKRPS